jgi:hypothetical protein
MTHSLPVLRLDEELLHHFADIAPIVVLDAALAATAAVLWEEHQPEPELLLDSDHFPETACMTSHLVISHISQLRHALRLHLAEMKRALPPCDHDHLF